MGKNLGQFTNECLCDGRAHDVCTETDYISVRISDEVRTTKAETNSSAGEINTLARQVLSEASMLTLNALAQTATRLFLQHVQRDARCLSIEIKCDCPLKTVPHLEQILGALTLASSRM